MKQLKLWQKINEIISRKIQSYDQLQYENKDLNSLINLLQEYVEYLMSKNYDTDKIIHYKNTIDFYTNIQTLYSQKLRIIRVSSDRMN